MGFHSLLENSGKRLPRVLQSLNCRLEVGADEVVPDLVGVRTLVLLSVQKTDVCVRLSRKMVTVSEGRGQREERGFNIQPEGLELLQCTQLHMVELLFVNSLA